MVWRQRTVRKSHVRSFLKVLETWKGRTHWEISLHIQNWQSNAFHKSQYRPSYCIFSFHFHLSGQRTKTRTRHSLGKCSTTELKPCLHPLYWTQYLFRHTVDGKNTDQDPCLLWMIALGVEGTPFYTVASANTTAAKDDEGRLGEVT